MKTDSRPDAPHQSFIMLPPGQPSPTAGTQVCTRPHRNAVAKFYNVTPSFSARLRMANWK